MRLSDWLFLCTFIAFGTLMSVVPTKAYIPVNLCMSGVDSDFRSSFLKVCGKKIKLNKARVSDFASIEGISIKKARLLVEAIKNMKNIEFKDLLIIKGIGEKNLAKIERYFEI